MGLSIYERIKASRGFFKMHARDKMEEMTMTSSMSWWGGIKDDDHGTLNIGIRRDDGTKMEVEIPLTVAVGLVEFLERRYK